MARGPIKHLKRLNAPKHWMLDKLGGTWAPRPSTGPHKLRECLPLSLILRNRLKYALTRRETQMIVMRRHVMVDGKVRTDLNYPAGFQDVVSIAATGENFRLLFDVKGRFVLKSIDAKAAKYKLLKIAKVSNGNKATIGKNPFFAGQKGVIPYVSTHDGRTIRFADPNWAVNDSIRFNMETGKVEGHYQFQVGALSMIIRGNNIGRIGVIVHVEKHQGSFDIVHIKDKRGNKFATRLANAFIIGDDEASPAIALPKGNGIAQSVIEEAARRNKKQEN